MLARTLTTRAAAVVQAMTSGLVTLHWPAKLSVTGNEPVEQKPSQVQAPPTTCSHWLLESALQVFPDSSSLNAEVERPAAEVLQNLKKTDRPRTVYPDQHCSSSLSIYLVI